ncbi:MAG: phage tail protein [Deltaproteobacteria bacterium]|nr:phage tail protein [Deltaproteobacteria bacterium]
MTTENTVTTNIGREKLAKAHIGLITLPAITQIAFGNGGVDTSGNPIPPDGTETTVPGQFILKDVSSVEFVPPTTARIHGELAYDEGNGENVSACGLYDSEGDLIALQTFAVIPKTSSLRILVDWDEVF